MCRVNYEELKLFLNAIKYLVNIKDSFQKKRFEQVLGYPLLDESSVSLSGSNFGLYGLNNLDDNYI